MPVVSLESLPLETHPLFELIRNPIPMKVSACTPSPVLVMAPVVVQTSPQPKQTSDAQATLAKLDETKMAEQATAMAYQALNQLFFADSGSQSGYLQKAKGLAQLAEFQSLGLSGFSAKTANQLALQALAQVQQLEEQCAGQKSQSLNQVA